MSRQTDAAPTTPKLIYLTKIELPDREPDVKSCRSAVIQSPRRPNDATGSLCLYLRTCSVRIIPICRFIDLSKNDRENYLVKKNGEPSLCDKVAVNGEGSSLSRARTATVLRLSQASMMQGRAAKFKFARTERCPLAVSSQALTRMRNMKTQVAPLS